LEVGQEQGLLGKSQHIDTTSLSLYGDYAQCELEGYEGLTIAYGHAKNGRVDLKQVILSLTMTGYLSGMSHWMAIHRIKKA